MRAPEFWKADGVAAALLSPLGIVYGWSVAARQARANPFRPKARVICVGNLTAGGSGKTPVAIAIANILSTRRTQGNVISSPAAMAGGCTGRWKSIRTHRVIRRAMSATSPCCSRPMGRPSSRATARKAPRLPTPSARTVIVMDDGFQNFRIAKDLSLVVVDAVSGFGNGRLIPAGPLREPVAQGLARADAIVLVGDGTPALPPFRWPDSARAASFQIGSGSLCAGTALLLSPGSDGPRNSSRCCARSAHRLSPRNPILTTTVSARPSFLTSNELRSGPARS